MTTALRVWRLRKDHTWLDACIRDDADAGVEIQWKKVKRVNGAYGFYSLWMKIGILLDCEDFGVKKILVNVMLGELYSTKGINE